MAAWTALFSASYLSRKARILLFYPVENLVADPRELVENVIEKRGFSTRFSTGWYSGLRAWCSFGYRTTQIIIIIISCSSNRATSTNQQHAACHISVKKIFHRAPMKNLNTDVAACCWFVDVALLLLIKMMMMMMMMVAWCAISHWSPTKFLISWHYNYYSLYLLPWIRGTVSSHVAVSSCPKITRNLNCFKSSTDWKLPHFPARFRTPVSLRLPQICHWACLPLQRGFVCPWSHW